MKKTSLPLLIAFYILISSFILTFIIPPFQKTDEEVHYLKTIAVATGNFFCSDHGSGQSSNNIPQLYADLPTRLFADFTDQNSSNRFPISSLKNAMGVDQTAVQTQVEETSSCSLPFIFYLPAAIILFLPIKLQMAPLLVFYLGRLTFLVLAWVIISMAYKIIPKKYRLLLLGYLALPMVGIQLGSFNKEVFHLVAGAIVFASYLRLREKFSKKLLFLLVVSLFTMVLARPFYAPLFILIPLVLPKKSFRYFLAGALTLMAVFLLFLPQVALFHNGTMSDFGVSSALQIQYLSRNPFQFFSVLLSSYNNHIDAYIKSLIGTYGSIHYYLDWYIYAIFGVWLAWLSFYYRKKPIKFSSKEILGLSIAIISTVLASFFLFYLYATPVAFHYVVDIQGRYFISLLPFVILLISRAIKKYPKILLILAFSLSLFFLTKNAYDRYFDYSAGYIYQDAEKLAKTSLALKLKSIKIDAPITQAVSIDKDRELRGITMIVINEAEKITAPLLVEFYNSDCSTLLHTTILTNHLKNSTHSIDTPIRLADKNTTLLCIKIGPFGNHPQNAEVANLALELESDPDNQRIFMMPYYAF